MDKVKVAVVCGTARTGSMSLVVANFITNFGNTLENVECRLVDPSKLEIDKSDGRKNPNQEWIEINKWADAYFLVVPEYNHGYPGTLKKLLDSDFDNYKRKPVGLAGVSSGNWGGVRVIENLIPVLRTLGMILLSKDVQFPRVQDLFDETGKIKNKEYEGFVKEVFDEIVYFCERIKN
ncbi:MAG: FMN reductase [Candidatus Dojkabacteria bacterium]|nr:MAG: FMN reductase [Candidatus Dojkabacteria bacterium]